MMDPKSLLCVVCSANVENSDSDNSSNYSNFAQFCGEVEKCGKQNDKPFNATEFFHNVDQAASYLIVCSECQKYINEAMEIRANLEKWEMEVLKLQIELLMKLRELEKCNDIYFSKMKSIYDKVKISVGKEVEEKGMDFSATSLRKDDVLVFREKILDVVSHLGLFRDDLSGKLLNPLILEVPAPSPDQPEMDDWQPADDFSPMQIDYLKDERPLSQQDSISDNDDTIPSQNDDYIANEEVSSADDDNNDNDVGEKVFIPKKSQKKKSQKNKKSGEKGKLFTNFPTLPFQLPEDTSSHKKILIQSILIPPNVSLHPPFTHDTAYTFMLQKYPWNYCPATDNLTLSTLPITITEETTSENDEILTLTCSTCNFSTIYNHTDHFRHHSRAIFTTVRKIFEHVISSHLDGFQCPFDPKCVRKMSSFRVFCKHLKTLHGSSGNSGKIQNSSENESDDDDPQDPMPDPTSNHKKSIIDYISIFPPTSPLEPPFTCEAVYKFMLQKYPWNYSPTSDTLTLATLPITVMDTQTKSTYSLKCSTCLFSATYKDIALLARRMFEHVVTSHLDGFQCLLDSKCGKIFCDLKVLCKHLTRSHISGIRKGGLFHCSVCGKGLGTFSDCLAHEETHKEREQRDYVVCEDCGTRLLRTSLWMHRNHFCGEKRGPRSVCQVCGVSFSRERTLRWHMLRKHVGEEGKRWGCEVCGKRYGMKIDLKNHKINKHRIYPDGMDKECRKGCGKKFSWQSSLGKHEDKCDGVWAN